MTEVDQIVPGNSAANGARDLRNGVIIVLSGGPFDWTNPQEVRDRMDTLNSEVNADPFVSANTGGNGLTFMLLPDQETHHIHQARWKDICSNPKVTAASPLILIGHSNGGAAVIDLARWLNEQGTPVDFVFTADSVFTLEDNGNCYQVPPNVKLNLNTHTIPTPFWVVLPFPFGENNHREQGGSLDGILNIGLPFQEPGALAHRDCFYIIAGGDQTGQGAFKYPELIRDSTLAVLKGATDDAVIQLAQQYLQVLANEMNISIDVESSTFNTTLLPTDLAPEDQTPRLSDASVTEMRKAMTNLEKVRLSAH